MPGLDGQRLDYGPRSNDSDFAELGPPETTTEAAAPPNRPVTQLLAFKVGIATSESDLVRVQALRQAAYGHHLPGIAATFSKPDPVDRWPDVTIFYAEDKQRGHLVGAARIQSNRTNPLLIERSLQLPPELRGRLLAEITRMTVLAGYAHPVKLALVKAAHLYCVAMQIGGIVAASRPKLLRQYTSLGFSDLYGDDRLVPMAHAAGMEHRVLFRDPVTSEAEGRARNHPDYAFVFRTYHPDIQVFDAVDQAPARLRSPTAGYSKAA